VSPVKSELGFHISEDDVLHSKLRENHKSYSGMLVADDGATGDCAVGSHAAQHEYAAVLRPR
jgi:hypothetical protein